MNTAIENIVIRVDAGPEIGVGHFMRMIALGEILTESGHVLHFLTRAKDPFLLGLLANRKFNVHDLTKIEPGSDSDFDILVKFSKSVDAKCIVLDGDFSSSEQERKLKSMGIRLIRVCDSPEIHHYADIVICPNYGFERTSFSAEAYSYVATGPRYALIRKEITSLDFQKRHEIGSSLPSVIISLGGSNSPKGSLIPKILEAVDLLDSQFSFEVITKTNDEDYPRKLMNADLGIFSTGSSMWDAAFFGLPFFTISLNDRQKDYAELLRNNQIIDDTLYCRETTVEKLVLTIKKYFGSSGDELRFKLKKALLALEVGSLTAETFNSFLESRQKNDQF